MRGATNPKKMALELIKDLPATSTMEEILYQLKFVDSVMKGLQDAKEGKTMSTQELRSKMKEWRK